MLVIQEDKRHLSLEDPQPQLVAAFTLNNQKREQTLGLPALPSNVIAGITLKDTSPIFYKVNVTTELVTAVGGGGYLETQTMSQDRSVVGARA